MTPQLRFPEFTDEWRVKKLGDMADFRRGSFPQPYGLPQWYDDKNGSPFVQVFDVADNFKLKPKTKRLISEAAQKMSVRIPKGSLIITIQGSIGRVAVTQYDAYVDRTLLFIRGVKLDISMELLSYLLFLKFEDEKLRAPGGTIKTITKDVLSSFKLAYPESTAEQEKIVDFLTAVDERIAVGEKKLELLETYKRGVMQKIFSQQVRFRDENGNPYPDWEEKKLESLLVKNKKRNKNLEINYVQSVSNARGFVSQNDYFDGANIASKNTSNYFIIEKSTFAYNPSRINVGSLAYKSDETTSIVSPLYVSFKSRAGLLDAFLLPWFSTELFKKQMNRSFEGSVRDTLSFEALSDMRLMLPNEQEQQKIANFLTTLDDKITAEKSKLTATRQFKKALLQRMFV